MKAKFDYIVDDGALPKIPIGLINGGKGIVVSGLVDSGSAINVLPHSVGLELGLEWENQTVPVPLSGSLTKIKARAVVILGKVQGFSPEKLVFAWTSEDASPVILGQANFFSIYKICFDRVRNEIQVEKSIID